MPKPCPRCGLENTDKATHCSRCDASLRDGPAISPTLRRLLLGLAGFAVITTIGVAALVYVHQTAIPLGDPVVAAIDEAARDAAFAREQALEVPPPTATGASQAPLAAGDVRTPTLPQAPTTSTAAAPGDAPTASGDATPPPPLDALLGEEDVTAQMPAIPSGVQWNREILPPTHAPSPMMPELTPAAVPGSDPAQFPESNPISSTSPVAPPDAGPSPGEPATAPNGPAGPGTESPIPSTPPQQAGSLAAAQQAQCVNEGFLTRFACRERVRLRFCENRWDRHPDCTLQSNAINY